jgi:hypothetical protein
LFGINRPTMTAMKIIPKIVFSLFILLPIRMATSDLANAQVNGDLDKIKTSAIFSVEIMAIPAYVRTHIAVNQDAIRRNYHYKVIVRDMNSTPYREGFMRALLSTTAMPKSSPSDLRWCIVFRDQNQSEIGAIYFNRNGKTGAINQNNVAFGGNLYDWLDRNFAGIMK